MAKRALPALTGLLLCAGLTAHADWPPSTAGLVWIWENGSASNTVPTPDGIGRLSRVLPLGRATFNRFWAMDLAGGSFRAEAEADHLLRETYRNADAFTLEAVLTGGQSGALHDIVSFGLATEAAGRCNRFQRPPEACAQHGFVLGGRAGAILFGIAGPDSAGYRVFDVGAPPGEGPLHVVAAFLDGQVDVYANGQQTYLDGPHFDLSTTPDAVLRFGAPAPWDGTVEGIALYSRALTNAEASAHFAAYAPRLAHRTPLPIFRVDARLAEKRRIPRADVYPDSLVVYDYRVEQVSHGDYGEEKLLVAHRGNLNGNRNGAITDLVVGRRYALDLEPFEAHPELAALQMVGNDEDWHLPLFYAVSAPTLVR